MELNINNEVEEKTLSPTAVLEFTKELSQNVEIEDTLAYNLPTDDGKFTDENLIKINKTYNSIIKDFASTNDANIYEVIQLGKNYNIIREYDNENDRIRNLQISCDELPKGYKVGMFLQKTNDEYVLDKDLTKSVYYKMKEYETDLLNEQQKDLKKMRKNGELYYVKSVER